MEKKKSRRKIDLVLKNTDLPSNGDHLHIDVYINLPSVEALSSYLSAQDPLYT